MYVPSFYKREVDRLQDSLFGDLGRNGRKRHVHEKEERGSSQYMLFNSYLIPKQKKDLTTIEA